MAANIDTLRRIITTGLGAALMTEESLSKMLGDMKLPREAKKYLVSQAQKRKADLSNILAKEIKDFLGRINIHEELRKALTGLKIDVSAHIEIDRHGPSVRLTKTHSSKARTKRTTKAAGKRSSAAL